MARPHGRPVVIDTDPGAGLSPRLIPLDVTRQVAMHRAAIRRLTTNTSDPVCLFFGDATGPALDFAERVEGEPVFPFHDPLAVAAAADPSFIEWAPLKLRSKPRNL